MICTSCLKNISNDTFYLKSYRWYKMFIKNTSCYYKTEPLSKAELFVLKASPLSKKELSTVLCQDCYIIRDIIE
jgi:hypothetical protein